MTYLHFCTYSNEFLQQVIPTIRGAWPAVLGQTLMDTERLLEEEEEKAPGLGEGQAAVEEPEAAEELEKDAERLLEEAEEEAPGLGEGQAAVEEPEATVELEEEARAEDTVRSLEEMEDAEEEEALGLGEGQAAIKIAAELEEEEEEEAEKPIKEKPVEFEKNATGFVGYIVVISLIVSIGGVLSGCSHGFPSPTLLDLEEAYRQGDRVTAFSSSSKYAGTFAVSPTPPIITQCIQCALSCRP